MSYLEYSTQAPFESDSSIYVGSSANQLGLHLLNLYDVYNYQKVTISIEQPVFPDYEEDYRGLNMTEEQYNHATKYDENMFTMSWGMPFKEFLDSKDGIIYPMFLDLVHEAKQYIRFEWCGGDIFKWKKLISLYIAHHLEMFFEVLKDMENDRSLNVRINDEQEHKKIVIGQEVMKKYDVTVYGRLFWQEYRPIAKYRNPIWGVI